MSHSVQMPALGESVTEGTVTRWLKSEGESGRGRRAVARGLDGQGRHRDPLAVRRGAGEDPGRQRTRPPPSAPISRSSATVPVPARVARRPAAAASCRRMARARRSRSRSRGRARRGGGTGRGPVHRDRDAGREADGRHRRLVRVRHLGHPAGDGRIGHRGHRHPLAQGRRRRGRAGRAAGRGVDGQGRHRDPLPVAGTLLEISVGEDETIEVGAQLGVIGDASAAPAKSEPEPEAEAAEAPKAEAPKAADRPPPPPPPAPTQSPNVDAPKGPAQQPAAQAMPPAQGPRGHLRHPGDPQARRRQRGRPGDRSRAPASAAGFAARTSWPPPMRPRPQQRRPAPAAAPGRALRRRRRQQPPVRACPSPTRRPAALIGTTQKLPQDPAVDRQEHEVRPGHRCAADHGDGGRRHPGRRAAGQGEVRLRRSGGRQPLVPAVLRQGRAGGGSRPTRWSTRRCPTT